MHVSCANSLSLAQNDGLDTVEISLQKAPDNENGGAKIEPFPELSSSYHFRETFAAASLFDV
jgi:hypothetical protein